MQIQRKHFPELIPDNEEVYLSYLQGICESVDEFCALQVTKISNGYQFRISPSLPKYNNLLIEEILKLHNLFNIHLDLSKSIKTSGVIVFKIVV